MSLRVHILALPAAAQSANLCFGEDFAVVAGYTAANDMVLPTCSDTAYLVAGGVPGLPYLPALGHEGARLDFNFPQPVFAILVATTSIQKPIPAAVYTAPVPLIPIVSGSGYATRAGIGGGRARYSYNVFWSSPSDALPTYMSLDTVDTPSSPPAPPVGNTLAQLLALGYYPGPLSYTAE